MRVSGTSKKAIEDWKIAIVSKEYEKARYLFQLAVTEDGKSTLAKELEIIKSNYEQTKKQLFENKDIVLKKGEEISIIENLLKEGNIDEAKSQATVKLEEVKGHKVLEDRLNNIINKVNEIIENAKVEINIILVERYHM